MSLSVSSPNFATRIAVGDDGTVAERFSTGFALTGTAPGHARRILDAALAEWGLGHLADAADLIMSELVTNAVVHGEPDAFLAFYTDREADGGLLFIEVEDAGEHVPLQRDADEDSLDGRGLQIVAAIAEDWGTEPVGSGKRVWASLAITEKAPVATFEDEPAACICGYAEGGSA
jgi:anti-sigma regulatory factor (Ser/Thr protein kinase)